MTREGDEIGRCTGRQVSSGPETLPRPLGWPLPLPLWPGLPGPSLCAPRPRQPLALSPVLCASLLGGHWVCPTLDGAGQQLAAAWFSYSPHVSVPSGWEDFLQGRFPRVWSQAGRRPGGGVGGQGHSGLSVRPWLERLVPKKIAALYLIPKLGFLSPLRARLAEWVRSPLERLAASKPEPLRLSESSCASGSLPLLTHCVGPRGTIRQCLGLHDFILAPRFPPSCTSSVVALPVNVLYVERQTARQLLLWGWTGSWRYDFPDFFPTDCPETKALPSLYPQPELSQDQASPDPGRGSPPGAGWRLLSTSPPPPQPLRSSEITRGVEVGEVPQIKASEDESPNLVFPLKKRLPFVLG